MNHVHHNNNGRPIGFCIFAALAGAHLVFSSLKKWNRARLVQDIPVSPIESAPQGLAEIEGHAWPSQSTHISPVSEKHCVFYSLVIEKLVSNGKSTQWVKVHEESTRDSFFILDSTGLALVNPYPADCTLKLSTKEVSAMNESQKAKIYELLGKANNPGWFSGWHTARYRATEGTILVGAPAYALGTFHTTNQEGQYKVAPGAAEF